MTKPGQQQPARHEAPALSGRVGRAGVGATNIILFCIHVIIILFCILFYYYICLMKHLRSLGASAVLVSVRLIFHYIIILY